MKLIDIYPLKGTFKPGETVRFLVRLFAEAASEAAVRLWIWHLNSEVGIISQPLSLTTGEQDITLEFIPIPTAPRGYGVVCELLDQDNQLIDKRSSAFDVLSDWSDFPRYGFLTDFTSGRDDFESTLDSLVRFHINGLQFYDWQYRHDQLLPPTQEYIDPLDRELSLNTVRKFITEAHKYGMAAMPYLAVYAASLEFWQAHANWALYGDDGKPVTFIDFLGLMDPSPDSPWISHLRNECSKILAELPFDGLHVDQYGEPREGFNAQGKPVDIPQAFSDFIALLKNAHPASIVVFNAVKNWPIKALAPSDQDFTYIEIWPPKTRYLDLVEIVLGSRQLSGDKPVVIALYLPAERPANIRLANALIYSSGGSRIELGENTRLLSDPYFPEHESISTSLEMNLRTYCDFVVRYAELIGPDANDLPEWPIATRQGVWTIARASQGWLTISLVNLEKVQDSGWDQTHSDPTLLANVKVEISLPGSIVKVWWASPDDGNSHLQPASWSVIEDALVVNLPKLEYWSILAIELEE